MIYSFLATFLGFLCVCIASLTPYLWYMICIYYVPYIYAYGIYICIYTYIYNIPYIFMVYGIWYTMYMVYNL